MSEGNESSAIARGTQDVMAGGKRRSYTWAWKQQVLQAAAAPGASVARVAQAYGVNANQVFFWRRLQERGLFGKDEEKGAGGLLPVRISDPAKNAPERIGAAALARNAAARSATPGIIHIELPKARLRIEGAADPLSLRTALECLAE